ncbi:hypothetical protein SAMN05444355_11567 [Flavobacterium frigoris]|uniref:Uncharacterized protein n=2 Tax=Flavobacterium frigoris TaxID=229204 RepID=A0A1H9Q8X9_FLAFI|nr:hypothetical protein SAMN05444355_11567 [Flavobacterium frigoris]
MKYFLLHILLLIFSLNCNSQNFELQLTGNTMRETQILDSLKYTIKHPNIQSVASEIETTSTKLSALGYLRNQIIKQYKLNDSIYLAKFHLGIRIKSIHLYTGKEKIVAELLSLKTINDSIIVTYSEIAGFLKKNINILEEKGYSLAKLKLTNMQQKGNLLFAELQLVSETKRKLNEIVIQYAKNEQNNNFPKGHLIQLNRKYKNKTFNQETISKIHNDFAKFGFVNQTKYPEILFTKDTTKIFVYLEKRKSNTFDGFIGFNNNDNKKITFNGYLDLALENTLKIGEQFSLYWKSDGNKQTTFNASVELPYLFKSPIGLKAQLNIFKQDTTFQNTKTEINISYFVNYTTRLYLGYQTTTSSDIQNINNTIIKDYKSAFATSNLEYSKYDYENPLFLKKSTLLLKMGIGKRETTNQTEITDQSNQFFAELQAMHNFYINNNNSINIKTQNYYLNSSTYINNELYRFGGINTIRGFAENSLAANFMNSILTEYRYMLSPTLYAHTILDYCRLQSLIEDNKFNKNTNLVGIGIGIGLKTTTGLLKIAMVNGSSEIKKTQFSNTIIHISYNVKF